MNRRGFIGTLTALAGLALAKIKAPAATLQLQRQGVTQVVFTEPITGLVETSNNLYVFTKNDRFTYTYTPDAGWQWIKGDKTFIFPSDVKQATPENFLDSLHHSWRPLDGKV